MRSPIWLACLGPLCLFATTLGCSPDASTNPNVTPDETAAPAYLNIVHAATDVGTIDLYVDKQKAASALDYRKSTGNLKITPAAHAVELRLAGQEQPLLSVTVTLLPGSKTLLTAVGHAKETAGPGQLQLIATPYGIPDGKSVKVRLFNAAPATPAVDLAAGSNVVAGGASFGNVSGYGSLALLPAASKFGLRLTAMTDDLAYVTLPAMATPGAVLTVIAVGEVSPVIDDRHFLAASVLDEGSGSLIDLPLVINDGGPKGSLYMIHAAPETMAVDLVNDKSVVLINRLAYQQASLLVELSPGPAKVRVQNTGAGMPILTPTLKILPGMNWTVLLHGSNAVGSKLPVQLTGLPRPLDAQTSWRLANTLTDAPVLAATAEDEPLLTGLGYGQGSAVIPQALPSPTLALRNAGQPKTGWDVAVPQTVLDEAQDQLVTVVTAGSFNRSMPPLVVFAVLDNTATKTMAAKVLPLTASQVMQIRRPAEQ